MLMGKWTLDWKFWSNLSRTGYLVWWWHPGVVWKGYRKCRQVSLKEQLTSPSLSTKHKSAAAKRLMASKTYTQGLQSESWSKIRWFGDGCSSAVESMSHNREVMDSNPARYWAFFSSQSWQDCVFNSGPSLRCNTSNFPIQKYAQQCNLRWIKLNTN